MAKSSRSRGSAPRTDRGRPGSPRARLFLALEPAAADRERLAAWRDALVAGRDELRPVAAESLHLTLVFLGYRPEKEIDAIARSAFDAIRAASAAVAADLDPLAVKPVPPRAPRLFALDLADPDARAGAIQRAAEAALARDGFHAPEKRAWWPHVTLARVKRNVRAGPLDADPPPGPLRADAVTLYRSLLRPQGALYEPLHRLDLVPQPG